ncbi:hypothetical protein [Pectobacterium aroidearum]|uniref:hypothetical protein n=1 Tax=Pectobacterium aroidearum TaxID=1201031 RepID=UPI0032EE2AF3
MRIIISHSGVFFYTSVILLLIIISIWRRWYILDKKNLFQQKLFWISIGVPLLSFFYFGAFAWYGKSPVLSAHGYARFYEISKFPLLLLASAVPLASIVNNIHRTIQTEAQIEAAETKNAIDRYLAHEKNFVEKAKELLTYDIRSAVNHKGELKNITFHGDNIKPEDAETNVLKTRNLKVSNPYLLYSKIYKESTIHPTSSYEPNIYFLKKIETLLKSIDDNLIINTDIKQLSTNEYIERLNAISYNTVLLLDTLNVECTSNLLTTIKKGNISIITFTINENIFIDILEAAYYISKKLVSLIYGTELENYYHLRSYLYSDSAGNRFDFHDNIKNVYDFHSPEWKSYASAFYCINPDDENLAVEN